MNIIKLDKTVASRIAAGEVIDRPASVLRELLDNAIDSKATSITVKIEDGGISSITVSDNGCGIEKEDLALACESHATSKIKTIDDLYNIRTMGFRGEALCSIAYCSKLTILSKGNSITVDNGFYHQILPGPVTEGTTVVCQNIFDQMPARKQFLKRPSSEFTECKKTFIEKALGFENIEFTLFENSSLNLKLKAGTKKERALDILTLDKNFVRADSMDMSTYQDPIKLYAVCSTPAIYRRDRGQIKIFVNNRIIDNFSLVQVIANAYTASLPGGAFPYFYLFIEDEPSLLDFNIHPTKRECKIRNQNSIYQPLTKMIRDSLIKGNKIKSLSDFRQLNLIEPQHKNFSYQNAESITTSFKAKDISFDSKWFENAKKIMDQNNTECKKTQLQKSKHEYTYLGQVFGTFLIIEKEDELLFIDQHAAHERILYEQICSCKDVQNLALPYRFETNSSVDDFLTENSFIYSELGITLVKAEPMLWEIQTIPSQCRKSEEKIAQFISKSTGDLEEVKKGLFAVIACHSAIKANDNIDTISAKALIDKVLDLDNPVCPHGRSFVFKLTKEELMKFVNRTV